MAHAAAVRISLADAFAALIVAGLERFKMAFIDFVNPLQTPGVKRAKIATVFLEGWVLAFSCLALQSLSQCSGMLACIHPQSTAAEEKDQTS